MRTDKWFIGAYADSKNGGRVAFEIKNGSWFGKATLY